MATEPRRAARMTGQQRREQLLSVGRALFAEKGFDLTSVEEISARARVSKPVVYEHFGGKEGLYAVVVDREVQHLTRVLTDSLKEGGHPRQILERTALALLDYVESERDGFRILVRDSPVAQATGTFSSLIGDVASEVEHLLGNEFRKTGLDPSNAPMYAQMLVGMIALTGQWWLEERKPSKDVVAAHLVNLAWNGLHQMEASPTLGSFDRSTTAPLPGAATSPAATSPAVEKAEARAARAAEKAAARVARAEEKAARQAERAAERTGREQAPTQGEAADEGPTEPTPDAR